MWKEKESLVPVDLHREPPFLALSKRKCEQIYCPKPLRIPESEMRYPSLSKRNF
jgi:hypothetical protein